MNSDFIIVKVFCASFIFMFSLLLILGGHGTQKEKNVKKEEASVSIEKTVKSTKGIK